METKEIDELGQMSFKEYCKEIAGMTDNSTESYRSYIKKGLAALKKIIPANECPYDDEVNLLKYFLEKSERYKTSFEEERNSVTNCFQDFISAAKKYIEYREFLEQGQQGGNMEIPLNQILYGPPGTGKTYSTVEYALKIFGAEDRKDEIKSIGQLKEAFGSQVEFVTFHQSFSYEDFVEGLKANSDDGNITYDIEDGVFKVICENAQRAEGNNFDEAYKQLTKKIIENDNQFLTLKTIKGNEFSIKINSKGNLRLYTGKDKNPQGVLTKENIYKEFSDKTTVEGWKSYFRIVVQHLKDEFNLKDYQKTTSQKLYVLIIDEINRGNISRIFGELITLIEPSKRAGADEEITVQLPYSKKDFSVPKNLYIIGTMNTADRSLALMDTALRRRFDFTEMMPNPKLVTGKFDGIDLQKILESINERIEILYDREHTIGHSFLMNINTLPELRNAFKNKILPLLEEYFYDDFKKIRLVLNDTDKFYKKKEVKLGEFEKTIYRKQTIDSLEADAFTRIYEPIPNEE